jgi:diketogulonate reductase-like aldo/keto reductase
MSYYEKYLKYKNKYLQLKKQKGGDNTISLPESCKYLEIMPQLCFGTLQHSDLTKTLAIALESGIYHIDGADTYGKTEYRKVINDCIKDIQRNKLWITWKSDTITIENIESVIKDLDCDYIDTFLIHHSCGVEKDYRVLQEAQSKGLIRFFGNSNCEDFEILNELQNKYGISTIQIQARPPGGKIESRKNLDPDFIEKCNSIGINVMIFGTISGIKGSTNFSAVFNMINLNNSKTTLLNKYYIQKYCLSARNIIMISSWSGKSIRENKKDFDDIMYRSKLFTEEEMNHIENELKKVLLHYQ